MSKSVYTYEQVQEFRKNPEELARLLADVMNGGCDLKKFKTGLLKRHRTLQQQVFGLMLAGIYAWRDCYKEKMFDLRNEFTCENSDRIVRVLEEEYGEGYEVKAPMI